MLAALPDGVHPVSLRTFMTHPDPSLLVDDLPVSPRDWLLGGGAGEAVSELAGTLGEQV